MRVAGAILAAGAGRRFGDAPKQLAHYRGAPLLQHAIDAAVAAGTLHPVLLVLGARAGQVEPAVDARGCEVVRCERWEEGMSASLRCAVDAAPAADWLVVLLGDQPLITPQVIAMVVDDAAAAAETVQAVRPTYDGVPGHPVALHRSLFDEVRALRGDAGARDLLAHVQVRTREAAHLCSPFDVDTPEALGEPPTGRITAR